MASFKKYTASGGASEAFSIPSFTSDEIKVRVDGVLKTAATHYNITSYTANGGTVTWTSGNVPSSGTVYIYRDTKILNNASSDVEGKATYSGGIPLYHTDLNNNQKQVLRALEEKDDQLVQSWDVDTAIIGSSNIIDGSIVDADVNASAAIQGTKINPQFGTQNISLTGNITVSGTVDGRDVSVDGTKLDGVETGATADQTNAEIRAAVEAATDSNVFTDADHTKLNNIAAGSNNYVISVDLLDEDDFASDSATKVPSQQSTKAYITATSQPLDGDLTTLAGMQSGTASILASGTTLTSTISELNLLDGKSVVTSISGSSTNVQLPTAKAVNDHIVNSISDTGGFVPIANEVSFPNTNPDVGGDAGTIVSIADAGGIVVNGSGVSTTGRTLGGSTVTINGIDSSLYNTTIAAGKGMLVQTTSTLNTYDYHRLIVDEAGVASAQTLVSDFNDRYQIASSAPSNHPDGSALQDGDLWFDTTNNVMKVYDLGNTTYVEVSAVSDYKLLTVVNDGQTSGSPTYNGSNLSFDLRDGSSAASITSVGQLLVSLNGVLQQPNAGAWSGSNTGFHLEGTNGIKFCSAPASGASVFVTLMGSASSVSVPATNSIVEASIQTNVVSEEKLKISNSPTNGQFLSAQSGNSGGLTWATPTTSVVDDTSPQLGGDLDVNGKIISLGDSSGTTDDRIVLGNGSDFHIYHPGTDSMIDNNTGNLTLRCNVNADVGGNILLQPKPSEDGIKVIHDGAVELYHNNEKVLETTTQGIIVHNSNNANVWIEFKGVNTTHGWIYGGANQLALQDASGNTAVKVVDEADVELYYNTSKKLETTSAGIDVTGTVTDDGATHDGDVTFTGASYNLVWDKSDNDLKFGDYARAKFGTGEDLHIYHNGSHSIMSNATGQLHIKGDHIELQGNTAAEYLIRAIKDGAVELYYDNAKRLETSAAGVTIPNTLTVSDGANLDGDIKFKGSGDGDDFFWDKSADQLTLTDSRKIRFGDSGDLEIYHDGTGCNIRSTSSKLEIRSPDLLLQNSGAEKYFRGVSDGAVELYYDNSKKFETTSGGVEVASGNSLIIAGTDSSSYIQLKDDAKLYVGTGNDLQIWHDGSHSYVMNQVGNLKLRINSSEDGIIIAPNGGVELYYDNSKKFDTSSTGINVYGNALWGDGVGPVMGASNDFQIYHDNGNGSNIIDGLNHKIELLHSGEKMIVCHPDAGVELYYDHSKKFETYTSGVLVDGTLRPGTDDTHLIGTGGYRWTTVYATTGTINTSDRNEKNTIVKSDLGLDFVNQLKPVSYKWNKDNRKTYYGLIAQDVEKTINNEGKTIDEFGGLSKPSEGPMGLNYSEFISPLIKAIQELSAKVAELEAK